MVKKAQVLYAWYCVVIGTAMLLPWRLGNEFAHGESVIGLQNAEAANKEIK